MSWTQRAAQRPHRDLHLRLLSCNLLAHRLARGPRPMPTDRMFSRRVWMSMDHKVGALKPSGKASRLVFRATEFHWKVKRP